MTSPSPLPPPPPPGAGASGVAALVLLWVAVLILFAVIAWVAMWARPPGPFSEDDTWDRQW